MPARNSHKKHGVFMTFKMLCSESALYERCTRHVAFRRTTSDFHVINDDKVDEKKRYQLFEVCDNLGDF